MSKRVSRVVRATAATIALACAMTSCQQGISAEFVNMCEKDVEFKAASGSSSVKEASWVELVRDETSGGFGFVESASEIFVRVRAVSDGAATDFSVDVESQMGDKDDDIKIIIEGDRCPR